MTEQIKLIKEAQKIIGEGNTDDYILQPTKHYEMFYEKAPEFASVFQSLEIETVAKKYETFDVKAMDEQAIFKSYSKRARWSLFFMVCFSTALIVLATLFGHAIESALANILFILFTIFAIVSGYLTNTWLSLIKNKKLFEKWMNSRANAEMQRLEYFILLVKSTLEGAAKKNAVFNNLLRLEFFRRFQLDMQINYYEERGKDHRKNADKAIIISTWLLGGTSLTAAIAGVLGASINPKWGVIAAIGLILQALATMILNQGLVNQDQRNEERYSRTKEVLDNIRMRIDKVRKSLAEGNAVVLMSFIQTVHEQLSLEHRQWIDDMQNVSKALDELEQQLKQQEEKIKPNIPDLPIIES